MSADAVKEQLLPGAPAAAEQPSAEQVAQAAQEAAERQQELEARRAQLAGWLDAVLAVAAHYQVDASRERMRVDVQWNDERELQHSIHEMARQAGLALHWVAPTLKGLTAWRLPLLVQLKDGQVAVITTQTADGLRLVLSGDGGAEVHLTQAELAPQLHVMAVLRPLQMAADVRVDEYIKPITKHWLLGIVLADLRPYTHVLLASLVYNILALAGILFSMQVYDRVVPAQSMPTLYVLFGGVLVAVLFAWIMRDARMRIIDIVGKRADLRISDKVFGHALRVKNMARPKATGTFISQVREIEPVREILTSSTVAAAADFPFFLLFCAVFWLIAGKLVWVPVAAFVLLLVPSLLAQPRLQRLAHEALREATLRSAMLVEAIQGIEDIKVLQAEARFQNQWNHYNEVNADSALRLRDLVNRLNNWMQTVQGGAFAFVVFFGAPMVMSGEMSTGVLVAASILSSRMLAPLGSLMQVLNRWQQARVGSEALDELMKLPVDHAPRKSMIQRPTLQGTYALRGAVFSYDGQTPALGVRALDIKPGERIGVLGGNGAGKSTLLQALSGLLEPMQGQILLDGVTLGHIDPADVRRDVGLLSQTARLFYGTLRENLLLGAPHASDEQVMRALQEAGAWNFVRGLSDGLGHMVQEGGLGLSGGQRQSLLLARLLLRRPTVLLLDEPTAALDERAEVQVIERLRKLAPTRTLVVATHRPALLQAVDRVLVLKNGGIVMDGPREEILARLRSGGKVVSVQRGTRA